MDRRSINVLAISHSCVTAVNQKLFVAMNALPHVNVELLIPSSWLDSYTNKRTVPTTLPDVDFPVQQWPIALDGNISLHFYTKLPKLSDLKNRPDIILSTEEPYSLSGYQSGILAERYKIPYVFQTNQNILKRYPPPFNWIERYHYNTASAGIAYSEEARGVLVDKGMKLPSFVVPYGTDTKMFQPGRSLDTRNTLGLQDACVIGYMGRLVAQKGLDTLLRSAAALKADTSVPVFKLALVGSGEEENRLRSLANQLGIEKDVIFTGAIPHVEAGRYIQCMDIFVLPSRTTANWKEQFGRVLIESMACEVPVVGSDSGAIPVVIGDTGGGIVFREDNIDDLTSKLKLLMLDDSLRKKLGKTGAESVFSRYTFEAVSVQLASVLAKCVPSASQPTSALGSR